MPVYVAFLRGMNVGRRRIRNDELCECFEAMQLDEVSAFLASGNVIFESAQESQSDLEQSIGEGLAKQLKYDVPTFIRAASEVAAIAAYQPFPEAIVDETTGNLQVGLLSMRPSAATKRSVLALATKEDHLAIRGRELYWLPQGNLSDSDLDHKALDSLLGPMTVRTQRTLRRLVAKLGPR